MSLSANGLIMHRFERNRWVWFGGVASCGMVIGGLLGLIVGLDPILPDWFPATGDRSFLRDIPFLPAASAAVLTIAGSLALRWSSWLPNGWRRYYLMALIFSLHTIAVPGFRYLSHVVVGIFAGLWVMDLMQRRGARLSPSPLQLFVLLWFGVMVLSVANGGVESIRPMLTEAKALMTFLLVLHALENWSDVRFFIGLLIVICTITALIAISQEAVFLTTGEFYGGALTETDLDLAIEENPLTGVWLRPPAFMGYAQGVGNALTVAAGMALALLIAPGPRSHRWWLSASLMVMVPALIATTARHAILGLVAAALLALILLRPRWLLPLLALAAIGLLLVWYSPLRHTIEEEAFFLLRVGNVAERMQYIEETIPAALERHPIIGAGLNKADRYQPNVLSYSVHNAFLQAFAETGVLGLLVYTAIFVYIGNRLAWTIPKVPTPEYRRVLVALACGLGALLIDLQGGPYYHLPLTWYFLPLIEASVLISSRADRSHGEVGA